MITVEMKRHIELFRRGGSRVVGPSVLRVAAAQLLAHLEIGLFPEAFHVLGQLHGFETGRQQLHQYFSFPFVNGRCCQKAETVLEARTDNGRFRAPAVLYPHIAPRRQLELGRGDPVESLLLVITQLPHYYPSQVNLAELLHGGRLADIQRQSFRRIGEQGVS